MRHRDGNSPGHDGTRLYWQCWEPDDPPLATLYIAHGFSEHSGRHEVQAGPLTDRGISLWVHDQRGFGRSDGQRGHIDGARDYREDLHAMIRMARQEGASRHLFLLGHSMGSLVALDYAIKRPDRLAGVLTNGSAFNPAGISRKYLIIIGKILSRLLPRLSFSIPVNPEHISSVPGEAELYRNDPLVHNRATARWIDSMLDLIAWLLAHAQDLRLPLLMLHGDADPINLPDGSQRFIDEVTVSDRQLILYPGVYHETHRDHLRAQYYEDIGRWMLSHA